MAVLRSTAATAGPLPVRAWWASSARVYDADGDRLIRRDATGKTLASFPRSVRLVIPPASSSALVSVQEGAHTRGYHGGEFRPVVERGTVCQVVGGDEQHEVSGGACRVVDRQQVALGDLA
jgi:hypothetical protein